MAEPTDKKPKKLSMGDVMNDPKHKPPRRVQHGPAFFNDLDDDHRPWDLSESEFLGYYPGDKD